MIRFSRAVEFTMECMAESVMRRLDPPPCRLAFTGIFTGRSQEKSKR